MSKQQGELQASPYDIVIIRGYEPEAKRKAVAQGLSHLKSYAEKNGLNILIINEEAEKISEKRLFKAITTLKGNITKDTIIEIDAHGTVSRRSLFPLPRRKEHIVVFDTSQDTPTVDIIAAVGNQCTEPVFINVNSCYAGFIPESQGGILKALPVGSVITAHSPSHDVASATLNYDGMKHRLERRAEEKKQGKGLNPLAEFSHAIHEDPTTKTMVVHAGKEGKLRFKTHEMKQYVANPQTQYRYFSNQLKTFASDPNFAAANASIQTARETTPGAEEKAAKEVAAIAKGSVADIGAGYNAKLLLLSTVEKSGNAKHYAYLDRAISEYVHSLSEADKFTLANAPGYTSYAGEKCNFAEAARELPICKELAPYTINYLASKEAVQAKGKTATQYNPAASQEEMFNRLLNVSKKDPSILNIQDTKGETLLHRFIQNQDIDHVRALVGYRANLGIRNDAGYTPLHYAALSGNKEALSTLLEAGADPNIKHIPTGITPLHIAAFKGDTDMINGLIEHGADPSLKDADGKTAMESTTSHAAKIILHHASASHHHRGI